MKRHDVLHTLCAFLLCFISIFIAPVYSQLYTSTSDLEIGAPWPMFGRNQYGMSQSPFKGPLANTVFWGHVPDPDGTTTISSMTIDLSGHVYTCSNSTLYVYTSDGVLMKTVDLEYGVLCILKRKRDCPFTVIFFFFLSLGDGNFSSIALPTAPTLGSDNTAYIAGPGVLTAVDISKYTINWVFDSGSSYALSPPAIGNDGTLYTYGWRVPGHTIDEFLKATAGSSATSKCGFFSQAIIDMMVLPLEALALLQPELIGIPALLLASFAAMCAVSNSGVDVNLYAVNPWDGSLKWSLSLYTRVSNCASNSSPLLQRLNPPSMAEDGTIYVSLQTVWAVSPDGQQLWDVNLGGCQGDLNPFEAEPIWALPSPAIGPDGTLYVR